MNYKRLLISILRLVLFFIPSTLYAMEENLPDYIGKNESAYFGQVMTNALEWPKDELLPRANEIFTKIGFITNPTRFNQVIPPVLSALNITNLHQRETFKDFSETIFESRENFSQQFYNVIDQLAPDLKDITLTHLDELIGLELFLLKEAKFYFLLDRAFASLGLCDSKQHKSLEQHIKTARLLTHHLLKNCWPRETTKNVKGHSLYFQIIFRTLRTLKKLKITQQKGPYEQLFVEKEFLENLIKKSTTHCLKEFYRDLWKNYFYPHLGTIIYSLCEEDETICNQIYLNFYKSSETPPTPKGTKATFRKRLFKRKKPTQVLENASHLTSSPPQINRYCCENFSKQKSFRDSIYKISREHDNLAKTIDTEVILKKEADMYCEMFSTLMQVQINLGEIINIGFIINEYLPLTPLSRKF